MRVGVWLLIAIAAFFLISEHRAHLVAGLRWLPIVLLLACLLIHMFGHGRHGGHGSSRPATADDSPPATPDTDIPADSNTGRPPSHGGDLP